MDTVKLGAGKVYDSDGQRYTIPQAEVYRDTDDAEEREPFGSLPIACALGVTALPAPPTMNDNGGVTAQAEGVLGPATGGSNGSVVSAWDTRCPEVAGKMVAGDTALHGTHAAADKRAVVSCKENSLSLLVGNDVAVTIDRGGKAISISAFGALFQISDSQTLMTDPQGKSFIKLANGAITLSGNIVLGSAIGGAGTVSPVLTGTPASPIPSTSVAAIIP